MLSSNKGFQMVRGPSHHFDVTWPSLSKKLLKGCPKGMFKIPWKLKNCPQRDAHLPESRLLLTSSIVKLGKVAMQFGRDPALHRDAASDLAGSQAVSEGIRITQMRTHAPIPLPLPSIRMSG
jgi:hypothetical protein